MKPVLFFDGECGLCSGAVDFVFRRDPEERVRVAALQSDAARAVLPPERITDLDTFVYLDEKGRSHLRSDAALALMRTLGFPWSLLQVSRIIPRAIRDEVYRAVARHRYEWMPRRSTCRVPTAEDRSRFVEDGSLLTTELAEADRRSAR